MLYVFIFFEYPPGCSVEGGDLVAYLFQDHLVTGEHTVALDFRSFGERADDGVHRLFGMDQGGSVGVQHLADIRSQFIQLLLGLQVVGDIAFSPYTTRDISPMVFQQFDVDLIASAVFKGDDMICQFLAFPVLFQMDIIEFPECLCGRVKIPEILADHLLA